MQVAALVSDIAHAFCIRRKYFKLAHLIFYPEHVMPTNVVFKPDGAHIKEACGAFQQQAFIPSRSFSPHFPPLLAIFLFLFCCSSLLLSSLLVSLALLLRQPCAPALPDVAAGSRAALARKCYKYVRMAFQSPSYSALASPRAIQACLS